MKNDLFPVVSCPSNRNTIIEITYYYIYTQRTVIHIFCLHVPFGFITIYVTLAANNYRKMKRQLNPSIILHSSIVYTHLPRFSDCRLFVLSFFWNIHVLYMKYWIMRPWKSFCFRLEPQTLFHIVKNLYFSRYWLYI